MALEIPELVESSRSASTTRSPLAEAVPGSDPAATPERLLEELDTHDQHVDGVSAFEWLFTGPAVKDLSVTVAHFERFPRIPQPGGGSQSRSACRLRRAARTPPRRGLVEGWRLAPGDVAIHADGGRSCHRVCPSPAGAQMGG